ncbi:MAG: hypothetical protein Q9171_005596 [Xanthocarpia ochracea]
MGLPNPSADENSRRAREIAIKEKISRITKQQKIPQDIVALEKFMNDAVAEYQKQKTKLDEQRGNRQPLAKLGNTLQRFTYTWSQFMKVYAGLNEVAKGVDNQYGALASGTLGVLLQVGENKEGREKAIASTFEELTESWLGDAGRLKLYSNAHPDSTRLKRFVANVYLGVAELALESAEYYARPPYARFWQAIRRPPKLEIDIRADEIKKAIHEVDSESIALLIQDHASEKEVRKRERDQERNDQRARIARLLGSSLELSDAGKMIDQCKALHANAFAKAVRRRATKQLQQISIGLLQDFHLFEPSKKITESSVLVLSGLNFDSYDTGDHLCWLSPVTTEIAEKCQMNQRSGDDEDYVSDVLESILKVVSTASCKIRLFVTIDASRWPRVRNNSDFETKWKIWKRRNTLKKFSPLFKIDWQQPELQTW